MSESDRYALRDIAGALGVSQQAAQKRANREGWPFQEVAARGGRRRLYELKDLPVAVQAALLERQAPKAAPRAVRPAGAAKTVDREALWDAFERKPQRLKDEAARRLSAVQGVERLADTGSGRSKATEEVAKVYGESRATLYRWLKAVRGLEPNDWLAALAPHYAGQGARAECTPAAWEFFKAQYLRAEAPSIAACWEWTQQAGKEHGWEWPALRTINRWVQEKIPRTVQVLKREGEIAMLRLYPAQQRTVRDLHALFWINGDGYQHNVFVRFPDGSIGRPKTWFWQDIYSRRIIGYRTDRTEHSDMIRLALGDVLERYGIPEHATIDNTRAAANKWMTGGVKNRYRFKVREEDPLGLMPSLGIQVHWTTVHKGQGWGQAKPVERAFGVGGIGDYVDKDIKLAGAYTGPNVNAKPENYGDKAIEWDVFVAVLAQAITQWNAREGRRTEACGGRLSFDTAFQESLERNAHRVRKPTAAQRRMWLLTAEAVTVQRDGALALSVGNGPHGKNRYGCDALIEYAGRKVVVRFDPDSLHESVHIYQLDGRYIGEAECIHAAGFGDTSKGREWGRLKNERLRANKQAAKAEISMTAVEAAELMPEIDPDPEVPLQTNVVRGAWAEPQKKVSGSDVAAPADDEQPASKYGFNEQMMGAVAKWSRNHPGAPTREDD